MKKLIVFIFLMMITAGAFAQQKSDSTAYQDERNKINDMLAQRAKKFGQYDESLKRRTGIFGFQTKNDIRNSNAILMDIVKTDDDIYKELKILLDFRAFQQTQAQTKAKETEDNTLGYMAAINKLRSQVDELQAENKERQHEAERNIRLFIISLLLALAALYFLTRRRVNKA